MTESVGQPQKPEPPGERLARRIAHHVNEARQEGSAAESARKMESAAALARAFNEELKPALAPLFAEMLKTMPEDHPLRKTAELFNSPLPSVFNDLLNALLDLLGLVFGFLDIVRGAGNVLATQFLQEFQADHTDVALNPAILADAVERNVFARLGITWDPYAEAAKSGISSDRFDIMVEDTGEPYGIMEGLALLRRGDITLADFTNVLYYSRVRNEFLGDVLKLQYSYMSPADAVEIALKGIETEDVAKGMFLKAGGYESNWTDLLAAAGNPIGVVSAVNQYYHGVIDLATTQSVIKHSRINPMFEDLALNEHLKWLTATQIHQAVKAGTVDASTATAWLIEDGYSAEQAAVFAGAGNAEKLAGSKTLTESIVTELYGEKLLTNQSAALALTELGYSASDAALILSGVDARQTIAETKSGINRIRALYTAGHITEAQANNDLTQLAVPPGAITQYLKVWGVEVASNVRTLSEAQVGQLMAKGVIGESEAVTRWEAMGFSATDADLLRQHYQTAKSVN
jgi:hypothetical protein